jgi:hypothetical protein
MFQALASMCAVPILLITGVTGGVFLMTRGKGEGKKQQKSSDEDGRQSG